MEQKVIDGVPPYLHPAVRNHSRIERRLAEIMDRCHSRNPDQRPEIFQVVQHLHETQRLYAEEATRIFY